MSCANKKTMNKIKQLKTLVALGVIFMSLNARSQEKYQYTIGINEIQTEVALKESDDYLRPMFDVPGSFQKSSKLIVFTTEARLEESSLIEKLERTGFHVNSFSKIIIE